MAPQLDRQGAGHALICPTTEGLSMRSGRAWRCADDALATMSLLLLVMSGLCPQGALSAPA